MCVISHHCWHLVEVQVESWNIERLRVLHWVGQVLVTLLRVVASRRLVQLR